MSPKKAQKEVLRILFRLHLDVSCNAVSDDQLAHAAHAIFSELDYRESKS